jgi:hypothetical protein
MVWMKVNRPRRWAVSEQSIETPADDAAEQIRDAGYDDEDYR